MGGVQRQDRQPQRTALTLMRLMTFIALITQLQRERAK